MAIKTPYIPAIPRRAETVSTAVDSKSGTWEVGLVFVLGGRIAKQGFPSYAARNRLLLFLPE
jgi:hypothetical protein